MGYDAGDGVGEGFVNVDRWFAGVGKSVDEFVGEEGVRTIMAGVVSEWFGEHICFPPFWLLVVFHFGQIANEACIVFFFAAFG